VRGAASRIYGEELANAPAAGEPQPNASEALLDLRLPEPVHAALAPPLTEIGFTLRHAEAAERYGPATRRYTLAERGDERRFLVHVPDWVLRKYANAHRDALAAVPYAFPAKVTIYIFSEELDAPERTLRNLIMDGWAAQGFTGVFIPWRDVNDLMGAQPLERKRIIEDMLKLNNGSAANGAGAASERARIRLKPQEIQTITKILSGLSQFEELRGRTQMIEFCGLDAILKNLDYSGGKSLVAGGIVLELQKYGWLPDQPGMHALGVLLNYVRALDDLPPDDHGKLTVIIEANKLVPS
jgi:hypothetical protein